jgi:pimeloyl-ACP methyl ester carboxylesterase
VPVLGGSLGGWLAAEMAAMCPQQFQRLVLVDAMGVKPLSGEIFDMAG